MSRNDDFENIKVEGFKGNLENSNSPIINIKIREHDGMPMYKAEFRTNDQKSLIKHLNILKDKFGITCFDIKEEFQKISNKDIDREIEHLNEWREKTKGLRDDDEFKKKMRDAFSS